MKFLPYWLRSLLDAHLTKVDGVWIEDTFDTTVMNIKIKALTGKMKGVIITLFQVDLTEQGTPNYHVGLSGAPTDHLDPEETKAFIKKVFESLFPGIADLAQ